jgi:hypothetical protein
MDTETTSTTDRAVGRSRRPKTNWHSKRKLLGAMGGGMVLALAAGGVAAASSGGTAPPASTPAHHSSANHPWLRGLLRRTVHAQFVLRAKGGTLQTVDYDRGVLRSVTSSDIVIVPADAPSTTLSAAVTSMTRFRGLSESQLQPGDLVAMVYHDGNAVLVGARVPKSTSPTAG